MKKILMSVLMLGLVVTTGCNKKEATPETAPAATTTNPSVPSTDPAAPSAGAASACNCTEEWSPVCGNDGKTYSNSCEANCNKIAEFTPGECPK